jgi:hypothetical protein
MAACSADPARPTTTSTSGLDVSPSALALQQQFVQVVKQVGPSVVLIQTSQGLGSGIVFDADGDIVTNNHVVDHASGFQVTLADGTRYLAVLHLNAAGCTRPASPTPPNQPSGTLPWPSATPWGCSPASPRASSAPWGAPSTRTTGSRCRT